MESIWIVALFKLIVTYKMAALGAIVLLFIFSAIVYSTIAEAENLSGFFSYMLITLYTLIGLIILIEIFQVAWYILSTVVVSFYGFMTSNDGKW